MKSTTLKRANITKEKVAMMEALSRYNKEHAGEDYYRSQQAKNKELDVLWQSFGIKPNKNEKTPQVYFVIGLVIGAIVTLAITTFIVSMLGSVFTPKEDMPVQTKNIAETSGKFSFIPADNTSEKVSTSTIKDEEYVVKEGDTLESIVIRYYGSFDMSKVNAIQSANKMSNPNALSIGQKLIIPMNK